MKNIPMHLYLHIPFCQKACHYCDFHFSTRLHNMDEVVDAMCEEIVQKADFLKTSFLKTIYFGGGTPSLLSELALNKIFEKIRKIYNTRLLEEICFEVNPENVSKQNIRIWKSLGINRLSLGIQSFDDTTLQFMNRAHDGQRAIEALEACITEFGENISIDIIYNRAAKVWDLKQQNDLLKKDFAILEKFNFNHLSAYSLTIEKNTAYSNWIKIGSLINHEEDYGLSQYEILIYKTEEMGFEQYEISNFAKNNMYAVHNTSYWQSKPYLGIGPSAHSYDGENRFANVASNQKYINGIKNGLSVSVEEKLNENEKFNDAILCGLRTKWGIDTNKIPQKAFLDEAFWSKVRYFENKGWLTLEQGIIVNTSQGRLFNDHISSELFH